MHTMDYFNVLVIFVALHSAKLNISKCIKFVLYTHDCKMLSDCGIDAYARSHVM